MPNWDEDTPQLRQNLTRLVRRIRDEARRRVEPDLATARSWHRGFLHGLTVPMIDAVGRFRGEPGLEGMQVQIGPHLGVASCDVALALSAFEQTLRRAVAQLDARIPKGAELNPDQLAAVLDLCAWAHSEWIRIHPFLNGNGRIARLWANHLGLRYGLPPFVRLRPRPNSGYEAAAESAMKGDWQPTVIVFRDMLALVVRGP